MVKQLRAMTQVSVPTGVQRVVRSRTPVGYWRQSGLAGVITYHIAVTWPDTADAVSPIEVTPGAWRSLREGRPTPYREMSPTSELFETILDIRDELSGRQGWQVVPATFLTQSLRWYKRFGHDESRLYSSATANIVGRRCICQERRIADADPELPVPRRRLLSVAWAAALAGETGMVAVTQIRRTRRQIPYDVYYVDGPTFHGYVTEPAFSSTFVRLESLLRQPASLWFQRPPAQQLDQQIRHNRAVGRVVETVRLGKYAFDPEYIRMLPTNCSGELSATQPLLRLEHPQPGLTDVWWLMGLQEPGDANVRDSG